MKKLPKHIIHYRNNIKLKTENLNFEWFQTKSFPGQWVCQATTQFLNHPIGIIWVDNNVKYGWCISNIYVSEDYRKCGIASQLVSKILEAWPDTKMISTHSGNSLSIPFLKKYGFIEDEIIGWKYLIK